MTKLIKTSLVALSLLAGASMGYAADNNNDMGADGRTDMRRDAPDLMEREELDPNSTGSIQNCESQAFDEFGNCVVTPEQDMR